MSVGYEMDSTTLDDIPSTCNPKSKKVCSLSVDMNDVCLDIEEYL
jgi:hypothetical protein